MSFRLAGIDVARVITQPAPVTRSKSAPSMSLSEALTQPGVHGLRLIGQRLSDRLGCGSHALEMRISPSDSFSRMADLLGTDEQFIGSSQRLAESLVRVQTGGSVTPGTAVFLNGTCFLDDQNTRFVAAIKADGSEALLARRDEDGTSTLEYLENLLFGESSRLLKIGCFVLRPGTSGDRNLRPEDFVAIIFDHMLTASGRRDAAVYFYSGLLGCSPMSETPRKVREIFDIARRTIQTSKGMTHLEKCETQNVLKAYFRHRDRSTICPDDLAAAVLPAEEQAAFLSACDKKGCRSTVANDTTLIKSDLKLSRVRINAQGAEVTLSASPETFAKSVKVETDPEKPDWLLIHIHGKLAQT